MKNRSVPHNFTVTGSEQLEGWTLAKVWCVTCGEERKILCTIEEVNRAGGCIRKGRDRPWRKGDLLVRDGQYLDEFVSRITSREYLTWNAGGHYHQSHPSQLTPYRSGAGLRTG